jgi:8-hydroxy-5-deazaflavin:NADPH oxidoreductase
MNISILGSGNVGSALAKGLACANHKIFIGVRSITPEKQAEFNNPSITLVNISEITDKSDIIIFSLPPEAVEEVVNSMGDLSEKIIIDTMNSVSTRAGNFASTSEALRIWTKSLHVVKCFNIVGYNIMSNPNFNDTAADMFVAGNSEKGKNICIQLAKDLGFNECYDLGGNNNIHLLECFAMIWINLAIFQKQGRDIAFSLMKR